MNKVEISITGLEVVGSLENMITLIVVQCMIAHKTSLVTTDYAVKHKSGLLWISIDISEAGRKKGKNGVRARVCVSYVP